jgi:hypothetical protein
LKGLDRSGSRWAQVAVHVQLRVGVGRVQSRLNPGDRAARRFGVRGACGRTRIRAQELRTFALSSAFQFRRLLPHQEGVRSRLHIIVVDVAHDGRPDETGSANVERQRHAGVKRVLRKFILADWRPERRVDRVLELRQVARQNVVAFRSCDHHAC